MLARPELVMDQLWAALSGVSAQLTLAFRPCYFQHSVLDKLRLGLFILSRRSERLYLYKPLLFGGQPMRWIACASKALLVTRVFL